MPPLPFQLPPNHACPGALLRRGIAKDLLSLIKSPPGPKYFRRAFLATVQSLRAMAESGSVGVNLKALADPVAWMTLLGYIDNPKISAGVLSAVIPEFLDFTSTILAHKQAPLLLGIDTAAGVRVVSRVLVESIRGAPALLAKAVTVLTLLLHMSRGVVEARSVLDLKVLTFVSWVLLSVLPLPEGHYIDQSVSDIGSQSSEPCRRQMSC